MKKMIGFIVFWVAVGMLLMLFINNRLVGTIISAVFMIVGYNLFYC